MLRFVLTVLLAILTLALFVRLLTRNAPFRAAVLLIVVGVGLWLWWLPGSRDVMIPVPGSAAPPRP